MEHIILDTNIFIKENFLEGKRIKELLKLSEEGKIQIVLTKITVEEVKNNFRKLTLQAFTNLSTFRKPFESRVLRNNSIAKHLYDKIEKKEVISEFNRDFDEILIKSKVLVIDYTELDIKPVFDKYFNQEYPFSSGDKKSEFPDAFALALLEKWSVDTGIQCIIFSSDKDFLNSKSQHLHVTKDYENYLDEKLQFFLIQEHRIPILKNLFEKNSQFIDQEIDKWYRDKLDDLNLYYPVIWFEIHNIEVTEIDVKSKSYQIVSIEKESIIIEVLVELSFKVELEIDDENYSHYDNEDKMIYFFETKVEEIEQKSEAKILLAAYIFDENDYSETFDVLEINKDLELKIDSIQDDF